MSADQIIEKVSEAVTERSVGCERGIVGERTLEGVPIAAYALVAPACIMYVQPLDLDRDIYLDFCLN